ncbi:MAG: Integrase domain protein [Pedosphaera sp.]|nr:Integrase domain protein [Pedosphaera sp.]
MKTTNRKPVWEAKAGNVRVQVYRREQARQGKVYTTYQVADCSTGKRKLVGFADFELAKTKAHEVAEAIASGMKSSLYWTEKQSLEINCAVDVAKSVNIGLLPGMQLLASAIKIVGNADEVLSACQAWANNRPDKPFSPTTVKSGTAEYMTRQGRLSERRRRTVKSFLHTLETKFGERFMHEITVAELSDFAGTREWAPRSYNDFLGAVSLLYIEAQLRSWVPATCNPAKGVKRLKVKGSAIGIFQPFEARQILSRIDEDLKAYMALWLFSGCRKEEASRLSWQQVNRGLEVGYIELLPTQTKTGIGRSVPIADNLRLWLVGGRRDTGTVLPARWQGIQRLDDLTKYLGRRCGVVWVDNGPRHSYPCCWWPPLMPVQDVPDCAPLRCEHHPHRHPG